MSTPLLDEFDLDVRFGDVVTRPDSGALPTTRIEGCTDSHHISCGSACCDGSRSCL